MNGRRFQDPRLPYQVVFEQRAMRAIRSHVQSFPWSHEAGGQMFGKILGWRILVTDATRPRPQDSRTRTSFTMDVPSANAEITERFARGLHYLGDWHTTPRTSRHPRNRNRQNAGRMFKAAAEDRGS